MRVTMLMVTNSSGSVIELIRSWHDNDKRAETGGELVCIVHFLHNWGLLIVPTNY